MASPARDARLKVLQTRPNAQVVERGRGFLRMYDPDADRFILDTQAGGVGWHYGQNFENEVDTAWVQNGPGWEMLKAEYNATLQGNTYTYNDTASGLGVSVTISSLPQWTNGTQSENAAQINAVNPEASGDVITYPDLIGTSPNFASLSIETQTARLKKLLTVPSDQVFSTPTIGGTVFWSLPLRFNKDAGLDIYVDGVLWNEAANNPKTTTGAVEFRNGADTIFVFSTPYATDANGEQVFGRMVMRKSGANLFADVQIPYAWMQSAAYPIGIDPTIDAQVGATTDDGERYGTDSFWNGEVQIGYNTGLYVSPFFRFTGITLSGTIDTSYLTLTVQFSVSPNWNTNIAADDSDNPSAPTTFTEFDNITRTSSTVAWDTTGTVAWAADEEHNSPSINTILSELVSSYTISGDAVVFVIDEEGQTSTNSTIFYDYINSTTKAAKLHIEYTTAATLSVDIGPTNNTVQGVKVIG